MKYNVHCNIYPNRSRRVGILPSPSSFPTPFTRHYIVQDDLTFTQASQLSSTLIDYLHSHYGKRGCLNSPTLPSSTPLPDIHPHSLTPLTPFEQTIQSRTGFWTFDDTAKFLHYSQLVQYQLNNYLESLQHPLPEYSEPYYQELYAFLLGQHRTAVQRHSVATSLFPTGPRIIERTYFDERQDKFAKKRERDD